MTFERRPACGSAAMPSLRRAGPADAATLTVLFEAARPGAWSRSRLDEELSRSDSVAIRLGDDEPALAAALARIVVDELHVLDVATVPGQRRRGYGRRVVEALLGAGTEQSCVRALLELRESNAAALALYRAAGFVVVGRRPRYYPDGESATLMTRVL